MTLALSLAVAVNAMYSQALDVGAAQYPLIYNPASLVFTDGSGANQGNKLWTDTRTIAASGTDSLDLNGVLTDAFGAVLSFTKIRGLIVTSDALNVNDVVVGGAGSNGFITWVGAAAHTVKVKPGGLMLIAAPDVNGYGVTAATGDLLLITNGGSGTSVTYTITVFGS
jgi:hypothetical protein